MNANFKENQNRFLIIDNIKAYHIGASLKELAKKVFAFSEFDIKLLREIINAN